MEQTMFPDWQAAKLPWSTPFITLLNTIDFPIKKLFTALLSWKSNAIGCIQTLFFVILMTLHQENSRTTPVLNQLKKQHNNHLRGNQNFFKKIADNNLCQRFGEVCPGRNDHPYRCGQVPCQSIVWLCQRQKSF
jgi:hypothetical protein